MRGAPVRGGRVGQVMVQEEGDREGRPYGDACWAGDGSGRGRVRGSPVRGVRVGQAMVQGEGECEGRPYGGDVLGR